MNIRITATWSALLAAPLMFFFAGCEKASHTEHKDHPATIDRIDDDFSLVTLTEKAMERIDVQTTEVESREAEDSKTELVVPYSSLLYDEHGNTWVYVSPEGKPRSFHRAAIKIDRIEGDDVFMAEGPEEGTVVAKVGVAELYGSEFAVGH